MTDDSISEEMLLDWINRYCNQSFTESDMPLGVRVALKKMMELSSIPSGIASQSVSDVSVSFMTADQGILREIEKLLAPYVRMKVL